MRLISSLSEITANRRLAQRTFQLSSVKNVKNDVHLSTQKKFQGTMPVSSGFEMSRSCVYIYVNQLVRDFLDDKYS